MEKKLRQKGVYIEIYNKPSQERSKEADIIILTSKYYRSLYNNNNDYINNLERNLLNDLSLIKTKNNKIIFYDLSDAAGSRELHVIEHVDLFLKKQLLVDKRLYLGENHKYRVWIEDGLLFSGCKEKHLYKLALGWNLAIKDYSSWVFINPARFNLVWIKEPKYMDITCNKSLTATFRGQISGQTAPQRKKVIEVLHELKREIPSRFQTGPKLNKKAYLKEVRNSKSIISPYGYGEICYRDIEAFINGCLLIKPSMEHIETFPNLFIKNQTYIPVKWDLSDLKEVLVKIHENYNDYINIAKAGQENFKKYYDSFDLFYKHFNATVKKVMN